MFQIKEKFSVTKKNDMLTVMSLFLSLSRLNAAPAGLSERCTRFLQQKCLYAEGSRLKSIFFLPALPLRSAVQIHRCDPASGGGKGPRGGCAGGFRQLNEHSPFCRICADEPHSGRKLQGKASQTLFREPYLLRAAVQPVRQLRLLFAGKSLQHEGVVQITAHPLWEIGPPHVVEQVD